MTGRAEDYERTMAFADIALGQMKALRQNATPRNYEIWYAYATGYHPALNQQVNATLKAKGTISEADLIQIYENYLSPARLTERIDQVGSQVKGEIDQVMRSSMPLSAPQAATPRALRAQPSSLASQKIERVSVQSSKVWCKQPRPWRFPIGNWKSGLMPPSRKLMNCKKISRPCAPKV
jgi:diguanylate cyclase